MGVPAAFIAFDNHKAMKTSVGSNASHAQIKLGIMVGLLSFFRDFVFLCWCSRFRDVPWSIQLLDRAIKRPWSFGSFPCRVPMAVLGRFACHSIRHRANCTPFGCFYDSCWLLWHFLVSMFKKERLFSACAPFERLHHHDADACPERL